MTTILLLEDDVVTQRILKHMLDKAGYQTLIASRASAALSLLESETIHLMICDIQMPEISGLEFLKLVRADKNHTKTPVIMLTASGWDNYKREAMELGANAFLTKPTRSAELLNMIQGLLG